ncbi:MAG: zinc ribbon domain-containing protein [bacterium]
MYCPKCGSRQTSEAVRFCAKCGLSLEVARKSITTGAAITVEQKKRGLSPRAKGILQGIAIIPAGIGAMFVIDIFYESLGAGMMAGLYSTVTMIVLVALLRIIYALFLENGPARPTKESAPQDGRQHEIGAAENRTGLAATTGEIVEPGSITEQTTRQLDSQR